jgi:hypothetical protein
MKRKKKKVFLDYEERSRNLRSLGFTSYEAYLASDLWAAIRERVLTRDRRRCRLCPREASQIHHTKYTRDALLGKDLKWLAAICGGCHRYVEFDPRTGKKRRAREVGNVFRKARHRWKAIMWREETDPLTQEFRAIVREGDPLEGGWAVGCPS